MSDERDDLDDLLDDAIQDYGKKGAEKKDGKKDDWGKNYAEGKEKVFSKLIEVVLTYLKYYYRGR